MALARARRRPRIASPVAAPHEGHKGCAAQPWLASAQKEAGRRRNGHRTPSGKQPTGVRDLLFSPAGFDWVSEALYNAADQLVQFNRPYSRQRTYQYNVRGQLVRERDAAGGYASMDFEYRYSATANDGRIVQMKDWVSGEEVNYQYDELGRLIAAATAGPQWGLSWTYDGFGNRLSQNVTKGSGPVVWLTVNAATNRISTFGFSYDAAGNLIQWPGGTVTISAEYDVEGRMSRVTWDGNVVEQHLYDARNRRVKSGGTLQLYGLGGELLG